MLYRGQVSCAVRMDQAYIILMLMTQLVYWGISAAHDYTWELVNVDLGTGFRSTLVAAAQLPSGLENSFYQARISQDTVLSYGPEYNWNTYVVNLATKTWVQGQNRTSGSMRSRVSLWKAP